MAVEECQCVHPTVILPEGNNNLQYEPHFCSYMKVPNMAKDKTCLKCVHNLKKSMNMNVDKVKNYVPCIKDVDIETGKADFRKKTEECQINSKSDDSTVRTPLRESYSQIWRKIIQRVINNTTELPRFTSREGASRKYKRSSSFNLRRVVLLSSVLSIMGTIILIYLTLRVRQIQ